MAAKLQLKERYITCKLFVSEVITSAVHHRLLVTVPINRNTTKSSCNKTDLNRCTTTEIRWNNCMLGHPGRLHQSPVQAV